MLVLNSLSRGLFYATEHSLPVLLRVREGSHFTGGWVPGLGGAAWGLGGSQNEGLRSGAF